MLDIALLPEEYAVCQLPAGSPAAAGLPSGTARAEQPSGTPPAGLLSITWTAEHVSIICRIDQVPAGTVVETPWRCLRAVGPLNQTMSGVLAALVTPLAEARVNMVAFSAYDADYLLVPTVRLAEALATLSHAGHRITT